MIEPIKHSGKTLKILDQRLLPGRTKHISAKTTEEVAAAVRNMAVRGAPLIGAAAAYGYVLSLNNPAKTWRDLVFNLRAAGKILRAARPTANALFYALERMDKTAENFIEKKSLKPLSVKILAELRKLLEGEARKICEEDKKSCNAIANFGEKLLPSKTNVMTICNTGALATCGIGTALGVITRAFEKRKINRVYALETRPYLQGARLTMFELMQHAVPSTLITDGMAGLMMKTCNIGAVIVGADRIALNGDAANKIGTYSLAVLAAAHNIPFYVAASAATIDMDAMSGNNIPIEERSPDEICFINGARITPVNASARHPAFDITPAQLITAIITEKGIIKPINRASILSAVFG